MLYSQVAALQESSAAAEPVSLGPEDLCVASLAEDVAVAVAAEHRVERALAGAAREALLVVHLALGEHLLGVEHLQEEKKRETIQ